jgi:hypothetical protein
MADKANTFPITAHPELVEGPSFLFAVRKKEGQPPASALQALRACFYRLRVSGVLGSSNSGYPQ